MNHKRTLSEPALVGLLPDTDANGITDKILLSDSDLPLGFYEREVELGWFKSTIITHGGKPAYRLVWQLACEKRYFSVLAVVELTPGGGDINVLGTGIEMVAKRLNCEKVIFKTSRRGLIDQCKTWGAVVTGVFMEKKL